jgi:hypothetical protein
MDTSAREFSFRYMWISVAKALESRPINAGYTLRNRDHMIAWLDTHRDRSTAEGENCKACS